MIRRSIFAALAIAVVAGAMSLSTREASAFGRKCPPPPMMEVALCVDDPCDCCPGQQACVCIPCCCTEEPCVSWRNGVFGRRVATYTWACCGYSVDVVVTRKGDLIVRD